jgi:hypothetical protein
MKKEFVPYEHALELKLLGFDEPCFAIWSGFDENNFSTTDTIRLFSSKFRINDTQSSFFYGNSPIITETGAVNVLCWVPYQGNTVTLYNTTFSRWIPI